MGHCRQEPRPVAARTRAPSVSAAGCSRHLPAGRAGIPVAPRPAPVDRCGV